MDQNTVIAIVVGVIGFFSFTYVSMQEVFKYKLKKEQIRADAMVKAEEIKARNQLELEALFQKDGIRTENIDSPMGHRGESTAADDRETISRKDKLDERT
ncbi:hypothetical protein CLHUN_28110 [Ruminiclostridium hungatei]|uniref:Uncharacterized protein n=1 Tax=Ruminiclostridium hungatei TaxID=48256 RepID=A0A1V4SHN4_RUMHU|nr:hypothetical protein [Ruminiclostridium hungatei]OPX43263.1 hypothetical protein CLHUN_28110 [Ruminiclostridium hungatei]